MAIAVPGKERVNIEHKDDVAVLEHIHCYSIQGMFVPACPSQALTSFSDGVGTAAFFFDTFEDFLPRLHLLS